MIELRKAGMAYNKTQILTDVTCTFSQGEFTCIVGKNGCGKSTLLRAMAGLMPYNGSIVLSGYEVNTIPKRDRAKQLSYLSQIRPIPSMDVGTLIAHGRYPHLGFSKALTEKDMTKIHHAANVAGVDNLLDRHIGTLSGGERQRAYIAMTVAQDADIMLLDEPTVYLDIEHQLEIMSLLKQLYNNGKGIIMVAHDLPQAFSYADRIVLLADGSIAGYGSPDELFQSNELQNTFGMVLKRTSDIDDLYSYRLVKGGDK